ncbi:MAG: hypothetical protein ACRD2H_07430 [Terriglobales bacterium]
MKTTVEIPDALLRQAKRVAAKEGIPVRELIEQGLRHALALHERPRKSGFRQVVFHGSGLTPEFANAPWSKFREAAYERDKG